MAEAEPVPLPDIGSDPSNEYKVSMIGDANAEEFMGHMPLGGYQGKLSKAAPSKLLKQVLAKELEIEDAGLDLVYEGRQLEDGKTLAENGILEPGAAARRRGQGKIVLQFMLHDGVELGKAKRDRIQLQSQFEQQEAERRAEEERKRQEAKKLKEEELEREMMEEEKLHQIALEKESKLMERRRREMENKRRADEKKQRILDHVQELRMAAQSDEETRVENQVREKAEADAAEAARRAERRRREMAEIKRSRSEQLRRKQLKNRQLRQSWHQIKQ